MSKEDKTKIRETTEE